MSINHAKKLLKCVYTGVVFLQFLAIVSNVYQELQFSIENEYMWFCNVQNLKPKTKNYNPTH